MIVVTMMVIIAAVIIVAAVATGSGAGHQHHGKKQEHGDLMGGGGAGVTWSWGRPGWWVEGLLRRQLLRKKQVVLRPEDTAGLEGQAGILHPDCREVSHST